MIFFFIGIGNQCNAQRNTRKSRINITQKEFEQLSKWTEDVYNTVVVTAYFVTSQPEIEECV